MQTTIMNTVFVAEVPSRARVIEEEGYTITAIPFICTSSGNIRMEDGKWHVIDKNNIYDIPVNFIEVTKYKNMKGNNKAICCN